MTRAAIRVLVVDDDPLVRAGLGLLLGGASDLQVVGEAADGAEVVAAVRERSPDVVLMDVRMPELDGVSALRQLRSVGLAVPVIMLTTFRTDAVVLDALRAGACGFLLKHTPPEEIVAAIRLAAEGQPAVSPDVLRQLIDHVADGAGDAPGQAATDRPAPPGLVGLEALTEREREVADAVADGLGNTEIADQLHLSLGSVKAHISSSLGKLGLDNRVQLAVAAYEARRRAD